ncbi:MAG TPA: hypothetical protein VEH06_05020 [Candidatus Bathyarchaeia archaeon]|nr:hypothetical protein [Candidatus Bathyarchaeia archaeon]
MKHIAIPTFIILLVSVVIIGNGHTALAYNNQFTRNFSDSENNQNDCGNSCTVTSSNAISGSGVTLTPTLIPTPTQSLSSSPNRILTHSSLTLSVTPALSGAVTLAGRLTSNGSGVNGATITFTGRDQFGDDANLKPATLTDSNGNYRITLSGGSSNFIAVAAQFAGEGIGASQSGDKSVPAH